MKRFVMVVGLALGLALRGTHGQVPEVDEAFGSDPCAGEWICQGSTVWVPPLDAGQSCEALGSDPNNPFGDGVDDCTLYPDRGYVLLTPGQNWLSGNLFYQGSFLCDSFRLTTTVELRDGTLTGPADGMCVVIIGTPGPPDLVGQSGGGLGATGLGDGVPTLIFEFDTWGGNDADYGDYNHFQFAYSPTGFPAVQSIPIGPAPYQGVRVHLDQSKWPLNNRRASPAPPNRFTLEVIFQNGTVACRLANPDADPPLPLTRLFTYSIEGFQPFEGFLGVTAATGGAGENHILHYLRLEPLPDGYCFEKPATVRRSIGGRRDPAVSCGDFRPGDAIPVTLTISELRIPGGSCDVPASITISEKPPAGWAPTFISDEGSYDPGAGVISWTVYSPTLVNGKTLAYEVTAGDTPGVSARWSGLFEENLSGSTQERIQGDEMITKDTPFAPCGGIRCWNILGAYSRLGGAAPDVPSMRSDYLTDGSLGEMDFVWYPGARVATDFGGSSPALGILGGANGRNPGGVPEVFPWNDPDGLIDLNYQVFGGDPNDVMAYAQAYVLNTTGAEMLVWIACSSDDSIQVILNGEEVWIHSIGRVGSDDCAPQDVSPDGSEFLDPHVLLPGTNSLIVKVFEGTGDWSFSLRFQDESGQPIVQGLKVRKAPEGLCLTPPVRAARDILAPDMAVVEGQTVPRWSQGTSYDVAIILSDIRAPSPDCPPPSSVEIVETVPAGWTPESTSAGGVIAGRTITWRLSGPSLVEGTVLTYRVKAGGPPGKATFLCRISDPDAILPSQAAGEQDAYSPAILSPACFIEPWLLLGPFRQPGLGGAAPGDSEIRRDHLTDGAGIDERAVEPRAGDTVHTAYGAAARSIGLEPTARPDLNPGGVPTWHAWQDADDTIDFTTVCGGDEDNVMFYAVCYVYLEEERWVDIGLGSDDSVQVLLDGEEIWIHNIARADGGANTVQDVVRADSTPALGPLLPGRHKLMVKVFEGGGQHTFRLRFQDPDTGQGLCDDFSFCIDPSSSSCNEEPPPTTEFLRGDSNANGQVSVADALYTLSYLFRGGAAPSCKDAADTNSDDVINVADAILTLGFLCSGGQPPGLYPSCELAPVDRCVYPISPCGPILTRDPEPILHLGFDVERLIEQGIGPNPVTATVDLWNLEPTGFAVRGWSLSVRTTPQPLCSILSATVAGTLGATIQEGGLRQGGYEVTELVGAGHGAVSTVVLGLVEPIILPGNSKTHPLLKLGLKGSFPEMGCASCPLEFRDGLQGSGEPVKNIVASFVNSLPLDLQPFSRPTGVDFCVPIRYLAPDGPAASFTLYPESRNAYFILGPPPEVGSVVTLSVEATRPGDEIALYARWGAIATATEFDQAADARFQRSQRLVIPVAQDATCSVVVRGNVLEGSSITATLRVTTSQLAIESVSSSCGDDGCSGVFHLAVQGGGFDESMSFLMDRSPGATLPAMEQTVVSEERAELTFDVTGKPEGLYDLVARKQVQQATVTARLPSAVLVRKAGIGPRLEVALEAPSFYREDALRRMILRYANTGDSEMRAPLFVVSGPDGALLGLALEDGLRPTEIPDFTKEGGQSAQLKEGELQVLGVHPGGVAGRLPPGASGEVPILFRHPDPFPDPPPTGAALEFVARAFEPDPGTTVTWSSLNRPQGLTKEQWDQARPVLEARYGTDYHEALSRIATRLTRRGTRAASVKDIVRFAVLEALGSPTAAMIGIARTRGGAPLRTRRVAAFAGSEIVACAETDFQGYFALGPVSDGKYRLAVEGFATTLIEITVAEGEDIFPVALETLSEDGSSFSCPPAAGETGLMDSASQLTGDWLEKVATVELMPAISEDPNTKEGPEESLRPEGSLLSYVIRFENTGGPGVTAAANRIVILDALDSRLDARTVSFTDGLLGKDYHFEFATGGGSGMSTGYTLGMNKDRLEVSTDVQVKLTYPEEVVTRIAPEYASLLASVSGRVVADGEQVLDIAQEICGIREEPCDIDPRDCKIQAELCQVARDLAKGTQSIVWIIQGRVPLTRSVEVGEFFFDDRVGILPPHSEEHSGQGYVAYAVGVSAGAEEGPIINRARIIFDDNAAIWTDPPFLRGDCNGDGLFQGETSDIIYLLKYNFMGGPEPPCLAACDVDGDGGVVGTTADAIRMCMFLFLGTAPPPVSPYPICGKGREQDYTGLGCRAAPPCK